MGDDGHPEGTGLTRTTVVAMATDGRVRRGRRPTATSNFGVGRREAHDASAFYARFEAPAVSDDDEVRPCTVTDRLFLGDSRDRSRRR
jgi:site-specific DNA-methyltransferase (adenine-specific)